MFNSADRLTQYTVRAGKVQTHKSVAAFPESISFMKPYARIAKKNVVQLSGGQFCFSAVKPRKIGALRLNQTDRGIIWKRFLKNQSAFFKIIQQELITGNRNNL